ncbi:MAG TPA: PsiF family protein [Gammaproteobacteria bacterium]|nr:PsiF family protein [Gammaproteobacteria bacterium]
MKKFIVPAFMVLAAFAFSQSAVAADSAKPMTAQQSKFATCAHKSKGMKGEAHKKFMSDCLKGKADAASSKTETKVGTASDGAKTEAKSTAGKAHSQRDKMKTCNADAKGKQLKGKDRKAFMSSCLKGGGA